MSGAKEAERARQHRHAGAIAADDGDADGRRALAGGDGAGEVGDDQALGAVGDAGSVTGRPGLQRLCRRFGQQMNSATTRVSALPRFVCRFAHAVLA